MHSEGVEDGIAYKTLRLGSIFLFSGRIPVRSSYSQRENLRATGDGITDDTAAINAAIRYYTRATNCFSPAARTDQLRPQHWREQRDRRRGSRLRHDQGHGKRIFCDDHWSTVSGSTPLTATAAELATTFRQTLPTLAG